MVLADPMGLLYIHDLCLSLTSTHPSLSLSHTYTRTHRLLTDYCVTHFIYIVSTRKMHNFKHGGGQERGGEAGRGGAEGEALLKSEAMNYPRHSAARGFGGSACCVEPERSWSEAGAGVVVSGTHQSLSDTLGLVSRSQAFTHTRRWLP